MIENRPLVSVIIPVYNGEIFLAEAVASVRQQDYSSVEIIIVDDGSSDSTARLALELGDDICYSYQENQGPAAARNRGLQLARGEMVAFLDVDDLWTADKLNRQIAYLQKNAEVKVVMGYLQLMQLLHKAENQLTFSLDRGPYQIFHLGCGLYRRAVFDIVGLFDPTLRYAEDADWFYRARELGVSIAFEPQVTLFHRRHDTNMTYGKTFSELNLFRSLQMSLQRRRQSLT